MAKLYPDLRVTELVQGLHLDIHPPPLPPTGSFIVLDANKILI